MTIRGFFAALLVLIIASLGITVIFYSERQTKRHRKELLTIVVTTGMIGDTVRNIVGDQAKVITMMGPGVDPHTYEATVVDAINLNNSDLVFYNGLHLEGPMHHSFNSLARYKKVYPVSNALDPKMILQDPNFPAGKDPHIWFDVTIWIRVARFICDKIKLYDPANASFYEGNTKRYIQQLQILHQEIQNAINSIPIAKRKLVASHDAFGYFGRCYSLQVVSLQNISTVTEPSTYQRIALKKFIIQHGIKAIFLEYSVNHKGMYSIQEDCRKAGHSVACYTIYSDTIGESGTQEGTYIGAMKHNLKMIIKGLRSCKTK
ncbi:MAG: zinc ABC transporter substrate-binding protein [Bacteroidota bacterium]